MPSRLHASYRKRFKSGENPVGSTKISFSLFFSAGKDRTKAQVSYTYTALSESGNKFIVGFTQSYYDDWLASWERAINHYLATGETLGVR